MNAAVAALTLKDVLVGLADEGVPVRAISRVTKLDGERVRLILTEALDVGALVQLPRDDWPVNTNRGDRVPGFTALQLIDPELLMMHTCRLFGLTRLQARLLLALMKRRDVTREGMHQIIEAGRRNGARDETNPKMVDVVVCHTRKRLEKFKITIQTVWACGYRLDPENRARAIQMLTEFLNQNETVAS